MRTSPALYEKKPAYMLEIIFRPHLDMSRVVFGLPGKNKNETANYWARHICFLLYIMGSSGMSTSHGYTWSTYDQNKNIKKTI